jgi:hypothetical protein
MINLKKRNEDELQKHELGKINGMPVSFFSVDRVNHAGFRRKVPIFRW